MVAEEVKDTMIVPLAEMSMVRCGSLIRRLGGWVNSVE